MLKRKILVTAGPTYEKIDPVRFIGNYSSGKMGYAIAEALADRGAMVVLVSGPVALTTRHPLVTTIHAESAEAMYNACMEYFPSCDGAVMTAAVADYTPVNPRPEKTKRTGDCLSIELKPTIDIAAALGKIKKPNQVLAGFALETTNEMEHAQEKLKRKNFDFIVLNSLNDPGAGFGVDTNKVTIITKDNKSQTFELKSKREVAEDVAGALIAFLP